MLPLAVVVLATLTVLALSACAAPPSAPVAKHIAELERIDATTSRITLSAQAVTRIGLQTVVARATEGGTMIPYSAVVYDTHGKTFVYANPEPRVYVRRGITVSEVRGDQVVITDGPAAGDSIVAVGASQLLGIELGIGS